MKLDDNMIQALKEASLIEDDHVGSFNKITALGELLAVLYAVSFIYKMIDKITNGEKNNE